MIYSNNNVTNDIHGNIAIVSTLLLAKTARGVVEYTARTLTLEMESNLSEFQCPALWECIDSPPILTPLMSGIALMGGVEF